MVKKKLFDEKKFMRDLMVGVSDIFLEPLIDETPVDTNLTRASWDLKLENNKIIIFNERGHIVQFLNKGCFFSNTNVKILTDKGYKKLRDVKVNDEVLTHKNRWKKVLSCDSYKVNETIKRYSLIAFNHKITVTDEHPIYIKRNNKYMFVQIKDLKKTDLIGILE